MTARILLAFVALMLLIERNETCANNEGPLAKPATEQKTGRIEGRVFAFPEIRLTEEQKRTLALAGAEVGEIPEVRVRSIKLYERGSGQVSAEAEVGEDGTFVFEDAPAGSVRLYPSFQVGEFNTSLSGLNVPTTVREGETTKVAFFGKGRPVVGKVVLPENIKAESVRIRLTLRANPVRRTQAPDGKVRPNIDLRVYGPLAIKDQFELDKDGQFRIDGVREGVYRITADASDGPTRITLSFDGTVKAGDPNVEYGEFTVPLMADGESDKPHHLGTLRFKLPSH